MKAIFFSAIWFLLGGPGAIAQRVVFLPTLTRAPLQLDQPRSLEDGTPVTITALRFYVGQFMLHHNGRPALEQPGYHLVDASDPASLSLDLGLTSAEVIDSISFLLGVDSLTNVSGAFGGELDPIKGMYWAWNSGYINLKLEGSSPASPYASHSFELHLGGYLPPFATAQRIVLPVSGSGPWAVAVDVAPLLQAADVRTKCNVMSPGEAALRLSRKASLMFTHLFLSPQDDAFKR